MYTLEDVREYLDGEGIIERELSEVEHLCEGFQGAGFSKYNLLAQVAEGMPIYDGYIKCPDRKKVEATLIKIGEITDLRDKNVLDAGCGTGLEAIFLGKQVRNGWIHAVDALPEMIKRSFERSRRHPEARVNFEVSFIENLSFDRETFDVGLALNCLGENAPKDRDPFMGNYEYNRHVHSQFEGLRKVLKKNGQLIISGIYESDDQREFVLELTENWGISAGFSRPVIYDLGRYQRGEINYGHYLASMLNDQN